LDLPLFGGIADQRLRQQASVYFCFPLAFAGAQPQYRVLLDRTMGSHADTYSVDYRFAQKRSLDRCCASTRVAPCSCRLWAPWRPAVGSAPALQPSDPSPAAPLLRLAPPDTALPLLALALFLPLFPSFLFYLCPSLILPFSHLYISSLPVPPTTPGLVLDLTHSMLGV
jgi:hypothetical protein